MKFATRTALWFVAAFVAVILAACASIGHPDGGPRDEVPPQFVRSDPQPGALNFNGKRINIFFDENIKVEDVMSKVVVSPVQRQTPHINANGHRLTVELRDTLFPDETYTIDFSDAIRDLNENNVLENFAFDFSTGETRDSLVISGMLFEARTLEPAQGVIVGVFSNLADSAITTLPLERIAKTDQYGRFMIRNLKPLTYRIFAINDLNRDYHWDRTEDVAFYDVPVTPMVEVVEVSDTLRSSAGTDSIVSRQGVRYLPNDVLLTWFNQNYRAQYLKTYNRPDSTRIFLEFGASVASADSMPQITLLNTPAAGERIDLTSRVDHSWGRDSITYWLTNPSVIASDTLMLEARYQRTDTLERITFTTDTLRVITRKAPAKKEEKKRHVKAENADSLAMDSVPLTFLDLKVLFQGQQDVHRPLRIDFSEPIDTILAGGVHLEQYVDTLWRELPAPTLMRDSLNRQLNYSLHHAWEPGEKYRVSIDSASVYGIYGHFNKPLAMELTVKKLDDYVSLSFDISGRPDAPVVVELLDSKDKPVARAAVENGTARFEYIAPGTYYARAFVDANGNGTWDTGNIATLTQPEETYYYPQKLELKKNWDISQSWRLDELPVDRQKPDDIKKNKPKETKKPRTDATTNNGRNKQPAMGMPQGGLKGLGRR